MRADHDARDRPVEGARCVHARIMPWMACRGKGGVPVPNAVVPARRPRGAHDGQACPKAEHGVSTRVAAGGDQCDDGADIEGTAEPHASRSATTAARRAPIPVDGSTLVSLDPGGPRPRAPARAREAEHEQASDVANADVSRWRRALGAVRRDLDRGGVRHRRRDGGCDSSDAVSTETEARSAA